ncbi:MAG: hypothetical protein ACM3X6_13285 [Patescibacteria group bacterium]
MRKTFCLTVLVLAICFTCAGTALATPVSPAGEGFSAFAEYDPDWYESALVGVGYGFSDALTVGVYYATLYQDFGLYANAALGPIRVNGEIFFYEPWYCGMVSALYAFDLDPVALSVGLGFDFYEFWGGDYFINGAIEVKLECCTFYGGLMYYPDYASSCWKIGVDIAF